MSLSNPCALRRHEACQLPDCACHCHSDNPTGIGIRKGPSHKPNLHFEWEEPPRPKKSTIAIVDRVAPFIARLRTEPKRWARLCIYESKTGAGGAQGKLRKAYPGFEFTTRTLDDRRTAVFGRFVGDKPEWDDPE